jgi:stringent starvation protein B
MTSSRPYLLRAIYDWILDNALTPYVMVDAMMPNVAVPERFVEDGKIVLNIAPQAVGGLSLGNDALEFDARFSGIAQHVYVPVAAVKAVYAVENGRGMVFSEDEETDPPMPPKDDSNVTGGGAQSSGSQSGGSHLKIVK